MRSPTIVTLYEWLSHAYARSATCRCATWSAGREIKIATPAWLPARRHAMVCRSAASGVVRAVRGGRHDPQPREARGTTGSPRHVRCVLPRRPRLMRRWSFGRCTAPTSERATSAATTSSRDLTGTTVLDAIPASSAAQASASEHEVLRSGEKPALTRTASSVATTSTRRIARCRNPTRARGGRRLRHRGRKERARVDDGYEVGGGCVPGAGGLVTSRASDWERSCRGCHARTSITSGASEINSTSRIGFRATVVGSGGRLLNPLTEP
jgi:hypothetical protein